jgi:hypothetical protein
VPVVRLPGWMVGVFCLAALVAVIAVILGGPHWLVDIIVCLGLASVARDGYRWWQRRGGSAT